MIVGIDPGLTGGVAVIDGDTVMVKDMPVIADRTGGKKSIDIDELVNLLQPGASVVIEQQQSMPKQGVASTFQTGLNYGRLLGALDALAFPYKVVTSREWAKIVGKPAKTGKEWNIAEARRRWPHLKDILLKSKDGRADALLIAASQLEQPAPAPEPEEEKTVLPDW